MSSMPRAKKMVTFAIDPKLLKQFEDWLAKQEVPLKKTAVFEVALREFLEKRSAKK